MQILVIVSVARLDDDRIEIGVARPQHDSNLSHDYPGNLTAARYGHTATLLNDGKILLTGGTGTAGNSLATAELFDPASGIFVVTGSMEISRYTHTATLLSNGNVLVSGDSMLTVMPLHRQNSSIKPLEVSAQPIT